MRAPPLTRYDQLTSPRYDTPTAAPAATVPAAPPVFQQGLVVSRVPVGGPSGGEDPSRQPNKNPKILSLAQTRDRVLGDYEEGAAAVKMRRRSPEKIPNQDGPGVYTRRSAGKVGVGPAGGRRTQKNNKLSE